MLLMVPVQSNTTFLPALQFGEAAEALAACEDDDNLMLGNKVGCSAGVDIDPAVLTSSKLALKFLEAVTRCELGLGLHVPRSISACHNAMVQPSACLAVWSNLYVLYSCQPC